jgi:two-component system sensor histidine kinase/response regulator
LAVDDGKLNLEIIKEILDDEYNLKTATTGEEALEVAIDFRPDVILLDIMLPGMDGYEVCQQIRANPALRYTKIIMVSAKAMTSERIEGYEAGANVYIAKPFDEDELLTKIHKVLQLAALEKEEDPIKAIIDGQ